MGLAVVHKPLLEVSSPIHCQAVVNQIFFYIRQPCSFSAATINAYGSYVFIGWLMIYPYGLTWPISSTTCHNLLLGRQLCNTFSSFLYKSALVFLAPYVFYFSHGILFLRQETVYCMPYQQQTIVTALIQRILCRGAVSFKSRFSL